MPPRGPSKEKLESPLPASLGEELGLWLKGCRTLSEDFRKRKTESDFHFNGEHRQNSIHINCSNIFLDQSPKVKVSDAKISKWALIKLKSFCTAKLCKTEQKDKKNINRTKRQPTEWEKVFANDATDTGLFFKEYRQLTTQISKEKK